MYKFNKGNFANGVTEQSLNDEINKREKEISDYQKDLASGKKGEFTGVAFVSLKTEAMKQELIHRYKVRSFLRVRLAFCGGPSTGLKLRGQKLYVSQAAEPGDVYWENLHLSDKNHYTRKFFGIILTLILLVICGFAILYLTYAESDSSSSTSTSTSTTTSSTTTDTARLLALYSSNHKKSIHHYDTSTDSTSTDTSSTSDSTSSDTTTSDTTSSDTNTTSDSTSSDSTTSDSSTSSDTSTSDSSSSDSSSSSSSILAYVLAVAVVAINKFLQFSIPYVAS